MPSEKDPGLLTQGGGYELLSTLLSLFGLSVVRHPDETLDIVLRNGPDTVNVLRFSKEGALLVGVEDESRNLLKAQFGKYVKFYAQQLAFGGGFNPIIETFCDSPNNRAFVTANYRTQNVTRLYDVTNNAQYLEECMQRAGLGSYTLTYDDSTNKLLSHQIIAKTIDIITGAANDLVGGNNDGRQFAARKFRFSEEGYFGVGENITPLAPLHVKGLSMLEATNLTPVVQEPDAPVSGATLYCYNGDVWAVKANGERKNLTPNT